MEKKNVQTIGGLSSIFSLSHRITVKEQKIKNNTNFKSRNKDLQIHFSKMDYRRFFFCVVG
jgi:hypothetical protein